MKWDSKRSAELARRIAGDRKLVETLAKRVADLFEEHKVALRGVSYVFEPRVFHMDPDEALDVSMRSPSALASAILEGLSERGADSRIGRAPDLHLHFDCLPECGGMDPRTLRILEKYRVSDLVADDPIPLVRARDLMHRIVADKSLLAKFSNTVFETLSEYGITLHDGEGCVFTPVVARTPTYAQRLASAEAADQLMVFGPQVLAGPTPEPSAEVVAAQARAGLIETRAGAMVGIVLRPWWWIGIPAPELLRVLDFARR